MNVILQENAYSQLKSQNAYVYIQYYACVKIFIKTNMIYVEKCVECF